MKKLGEKMDSFCLKQPIHRLKDTIYQSSKKFLNKKSAEKISTFLKTIFGGIYTKAAVNVISAFNNLEIGHFALAAKAIS